MALSLLTWSGFREGFAWDGEGGVQMRTCTGWVEGNRTDKEGREGEMAFRKGTCILLLDYKLFEGKAYVSFYATFNSVFIHSCRLHQTLPQHLTLSRHLVNVYWYTPGSGPDSHSQVWLWLSRKRKWKVVVWDNCPAVTLISRSALCPSSWVNAPSHWHTVTGSIHNTNNDMRSFPQQSNKPQTKAPNLTTGKVCPSLSPSIPVNTSGTWNIWLSHPGLESYTHCINSPNSLTEGIRYSLLVKKMKFTGVKYLA